MKTWDPLFENELLNAHDYRSFLAMFFRKDGGWQYPRPLTFAGFTEKSGFSSKSFLNDIIAGRKRASPTSFERICLGLKLKSNWREYLYCLVARDEESFRLPHQSPDYYEKEILKHQQRLLKLSRSRDVSHEVSPLLQVLTDEGSAEIFASLGEVEKGETVATIADRCRLPESRVTGILTRMSEVGLVTLDTQSGRYRPLANALDANELKTQEFFKKCYFRSLEKTKKRFATQADSKQSLFMTQTFSVSRTRLEAMRTELADLILKFASTAEDPSGDTIAEINIGFTNNL